MKENLEDHFSTEPENSKEEVSKMNRREFLELATAAVVGVGIGVGASLESDEKKKHERYEDGVILEKIDEPAHSRPVAAGRVIGAVPVTEKYQIRVSVNGKEGVISVEKKEGDSYVVGEKVSVCYDDRSDGKELDIEKISKLNH